MPMILRTLFDPVDAQTSVQSANIDDSVVPIVSSNPSKSESTITFAISEAMMREKLKFLLAKK